jgi:FSR family fosmidomycin resistance protein-like MFS transporter
MSAPASLGRAPFVPVALLAVLALSHGLNDCLAGWLLAGEMPESTAWDRLPWLAIYAALAFAGQLPAAWVIDRAGRAGPWLAASLGLMIAAVPAAFVSPGLAVVISGIASAFVHVSGGSLALQLPRGERALGWFSAPGILGLTLGGWLGHSTGHLALAATIAPALLLLAWLALQPHWPSEPDPRLHGNPSIQQSNNPPSSAPAAAALEAHDGLMLLLLLALTLRSAVWDLVQITPFADPRAWLAIALSAAVGKVLGGWMSCRFPGARPVALTLLLACALLHWSREKLVPVCLGIALLQSAIPASIVVLHRTFGATRARATAYGLGLTVALGGFVYPLQFTLPLIALALAITAGLLLFRTRPAPATLPAQVTEPST